MKKLTALVLMQLKDRIDLSFFKNKKKAITKAILSIVKFAVVVAVCYLLVWLCQSILGIFYITETPNVMVFVLAVVIALSTVSCTVGLCKTLYFADDNKVLATFPVSSNVLFLSKLLVFYFYELIRSFSLLIPVLLGFGIYLYNHTYISVSYFFIIWPILLFVIALPVLLGALLSLPAMYIARLFKRVPLLALVVFAAVLAAIIYGIVQIISIIPENIIMVDLKGPLSSAIREFLLSFSKTFTIITDFILILIGEKQPNLTYKIVGKTFLKLGVIVIIEMLLFALVMLVIKFFFFAMMRKSFEYARKSIFKKRENPKRPKYLTFIVKEIKIGVRDFNAVMNYLSVYIAVPLMLFLLNKVFAAIDKDLTGNYLSYAFNMLIMLLPMLAANAMIAKSFSKEGRAAYIKKTKPVHVIIPLTAKFLPNLVLATLSMIASVVVFTTFGQFSFGQGVLLFFGALFIVYAHAFISASLDLMNPLNEQYATSGEVENNKNESASTLFAFVIAAVVALFSFFLFKESMYTVNSYALAIVKIFVLGLIMLSASVYMYIMRIKAFYYER